MVPVAFDQPLEGSKMALLEPIKRFSSMTSIPRRSQESELGRGGWWKHR
jgi:hypothetical protein